MCISAWRLIFGICVHWSLPPSAWTYFLRVNFSLSLALGVNGQKCWAWTIGWGSNLWSSLLDKTLWNWAKNKNTLGTNHMDRISPRMQSWQSWRWILKTFVVVLVVVETQPHRTDLWMSIFAPPDLFTSSTSTIFFSIFWVIGLGNHTYTIPKKRKKQHLQQHISAPNTPPKKTQNQQRTYLPTKTKQPVSGKIPFFFSYPFRRRWTEPFGLPRWAAHGFFASQRRCWVHRRPSTHQRWETSNGEDVSKLHVTWRAVTWQVGNWLVGWLVGWIGFFFPASKNTIRGLGGMDVFFFQRNTTGIIICFLQ